MNEKKPFAGLDPARYEGPIEAADGTRPWNMYLWPTQSWWVSQQEQFRCLPGMHNFEYVALKDGRFATDGEVYSIEKNCNCYGQPCVYSTRATAIRTSAARMIRSLRWRSRNKTPCGCTPQGALDRATIQDVINWTLATVARETGEAAPKAIVLPPPPPKPTGLPLFDYTLQVPA